MAARINPLDWDQQEAGMSLQSLVHHLDECINIRRMPAKHAEMYIKKHILCNEEASFEVLRNSCMPNTLLLTYTNSLGLKVGFSISDSALYQLRNQLRRYNKRGNDVSKVSPTRS